MEKERKEDRGKKKAKSKVMVRDSFIMGEGGQRPSLYWKVPRLRLLVFLVRVVGKWNCMKKERRECIEW
jgi:hypothetical protein